MRAWILVGLVLVAAADTGCGPSATVQRTTQLANLQPYRGLLVRGTRGSGRRRWGRLTIQLERAAVERIRGKCAFFDVRAVRQSAPAGPDDLILDLTVVGTFRGGSGLIQNQNQATVDVRMVLTDGRDQELVGAAGIRGKSSGLPINRRVPEEEAIEAVADGIAKTLEESGCAETRVARARPAVRTGTTPGVELVSDEKSEAIAKAEAENEEGKRLFRAADAKAAVPHFEEAIDLHRDPRYVFNLCLAQESLEELDDAVETCESVLELKPEPALAEKVKLRLRILADKQARKQ